MALQMTWQTNLHRRKSGPPLGLKNLGNTCYLNSVLQCLTYTPPLANFCLKNQHSSLCGSSGTADCPFCILERRIVRSLSIDVAQDAPSKINNSLRIFAEHFRCGQQEDAHEFLRYVIDACHNTCLKLLKSKKQLLHQHHRNGGGGGPANGADPLLHRHDTVMKEIFGGALQSVVKCLSCGAESSKTDEIMDISLDLFQYNSLKEALRRFFQPETLDGSNKYKCDKCKKLSAAKKQMSILRAPNILVIQLKRFEVIPGLKIDRAIAFEEVLTLSSYMCKASQDPQPEYNLFGSIVHSGYSVDSGHYYAYIKDATGRWYCCNDHQVSLSTLQEVLSEKVYILFFSRSNQRPRPAKGGFPNGKKSPDCSRNNVSVNQKATVSSKLPPTRPHGALNSEKDIQTTSKIGKAPSSPQIKFNLKPSGSKRIDANGNGNSKVHNNGFTGKHGHREESLGPEKIRISSASNSAEESSVVEKLEMPSIPNDKRAEGKLFSDCVDSESKQTFSVPNGKGEIRSVGVDSEEAEACVDTVTRNVVAVSRESGPGPVSNEKDKYPSDIQRFKRKSPDIEKVETPLAIESSNMPKQAAYSGEKFEEFKELLAKEAISDLRSCGWVDKVHSYMRGQKRLCAQSAGGTPSNTELKKHLIVDAKQQFISQVPESLKENLIQRLRSISSRKQLLDS